MVERNRGPRRSRPSGRARVPRLKSSTRPTGRARRRRGRGLLL